MDFVLISLAIILIGTVLFTLVCIGIAAFIHYILDI